MVTSSYRTREELCELPDFHSRETEDSGLPERDGAMLCGFSNLEGMCCLHSSGSSGERRRILLLISIFIFLEIRRGEERL